MEGVQKNKIPQIDFAINYRLDQQYATNYFFEISTRVFMKIVSSFLILSFFFFYAVSNAVLAGTVEEEFKIEGLISPASPKALKSALEKELGIKVIDLNLKSTKTGWPVAGRRRRRRCCCCCAHDCSSGIIIPNRKSQSTACGNSWQNHQV